MEDRKEFDAMLTAPLPGRARTRPTPQAAGSEGDGFMEFMSQVTAG